MPQAIELGPHLADLAADHLIVRDLPVLADRRAGGRAGDGQAEVPVAGIGHTVLIKVSQLVDPARFDQPDGLEDLLGSLEVGGPALVVRAVPGRPPLRADRRLVEHGGRHAAGDEQQAQPRGPPDRPSSESDSGPESYLHRVSSPIVLKSALRRSTHPSTPQEHHRGDGEEEDAAADQAELHERVGAERAGQERAIDVQGVECREP